jgi:glycosyltransferase involved in cell wall biosynthesis
MLTIIIPTYNEAENLRELLPQIQWATEILVVDSFSIDDTAMVAQEYHARVLQRAYTGPADQKNWAIKQAAYEWILILDADERLTKALEREIRTFVQNPDPTYDGYWIHRQNYFMGKKINYSGWQGDRVIRLIQQTKCRYNNKQVHEEIEDTGNIGRLEHSLEHYTYKDMEHFVAKMTRYAAWSAEDYLAKTPRVTFYHLWFKPTFRFFSHFVLKGGFMDGKVGFIISVIMAWGVFLRYVKIKEMQNL